MDVYTLDFETYYSQTFSLSKMTTEEYVRSPEFEVIGLGIKCNNGPTYFYPKHMVGPVLRELDFSAAAILCHNTMFDGAILSWQYGVRPKVWLDTLCMARAINGMMAVQEACSPTETRNFQANRTGVAVASESQCKINSGVVWVLRNPPGTLALARSTALSASMAGS